MTSLDKENKVTIQTLQCTNVIFVHSSFLSLISSFFLYVGVSLCMHAHVYARMLTCESVWRSGLSFSIILYLVFRQGLSLNLDLSSWTTLTGQRAPPNPGVIGFPCGCWRSNSGPHAYPEITLLAQSSVSFSDKISPCCAVWPSNHDSPTSDS